MATPRHSSLTDPTVQISRSGFVTRTHHLAQSTRPESRQIVRQVTGTSEPSSESRRWFPSPEASTRAPPSLQWVPWPPLAGALRFPTFIGTMRLYDCSPSIHDHLRSPLAAGTSPVGGDGELSWVPGESLLEACPELETPAAPVRPHPTGRPGTAFRSHNSVGVHHDSISELNLHGLLPCCVRFAPTSRPVNGNTRY